MHTSHPKSSELHIPPDAVTAQRYFDRLPAWAAQEVSTSVARFAYLMGVLERYRPVVMVEIGVSAGTLSGALLTKALQYAAAPVLYGIDLGVHTYFDAGRAIGEALQEFPELLPYHRLHTGKTALDVPELVAAPVDFVYIDANHSHPWAAIDCLCTLPRLRTGAVIGFHDVAKIDTLARSGLYTYESLDLPGEANTTDDRYGTGIRIYDGDFERLLDGLLLAFSLPWHSNDPGAAPEILGQETVERLLGFVGRHFGPAWQARFARQLPFTLRLSRTMLDMDRIRERKLLGDIYASTSWRVTAPLRWLKSRLGA
jgi:hypothetical protein